MSAFERFFVGGALVALSLVLLIGYVIVPTGQYAQNQYHDWLVRHESTVEWQVGMENRMRTLKTQIIHDSADPMVCNPSGGAPFLPSQYLALREVTTLYNRMVDRYNRAMARFINGSEYAVAWETLPKHLVPCKAT